MAMTPTLLTYLTQLCETATKGNVTVEESWLTLRLKFHCHKCFQTLTTKVPDSANEIDYQIQEFVKIHAHTGGHVGVTKISTGIGKVLDYTGEVVPLTADFKKLKSGPSEHDIIQKKLAEYDVELEKKDVQIKILEIQAKAKAIELSKSGIAELMQKGITPEELSEQIEAQQQEHAELIEAQKAQEQALKNMLKLIELRDANQALRGSVTGSHLPPPVKPKPLKISTGRKFR